VKLHARRVVCHWSNGLEQSSTEGGSLQMLTLLTLYRVVSLCLVDVRIDQTAYTDA